MSTAHDTPGGKGFDEFQIHCKLKALAFLLGNIHRSDFEITSNECYGIELFLKEIANEIDPTQVEGGEAS